MVDDAAHTSSASKQQQTSLNVIERDVNRQIFPAFPREGVPLITVWLNGIPDVWRTSRMGQVEPSKSEPSTG